MIESCLIDLKNKIYGYFQKKFEKIYNNSLILQKIDDIIFLFIGITLFASTFMPSESIGAFAIAVVLLTFVKLFVKPNAKVAMTSWDAAIAVYFIICFISTINSTLVPQSIHGFLKTVIYIFYYFCAVNYFQTNQNKIKYIFLLVGSLCCVEGVIAIYQNFAGVEQISTWQDSRYVNPEDIIARAYGTLKPYNPNLLGGYLVAGMSYVAGIVAMFLVNKNWKRLIFAIAALLVCSLAVFVTGSRGAYLGLGAIFAVMILLVTFIINIDFSQAEKLKSIWHKVVASIIGLFVLVLIAVPKITKRILSIFIL